METESRLSKPELLEICSLLRVTGVEEPSIEPFLCKEDGQPYETYLVSSPSGKAVLKKAKEGELEAYRVFLSSPKSYAPSFLGSCTYRGDDYFLMEYVEGADLIHAEREPLRLALDALIAAQDEYWERRDLDVSLGFAKAKAAVTRRLRYLESPLLERAYRRFLAVYDNLPRSLCHGDLLPFNVLANEKRAVLIDWEGSGMLPYLTSFARLIAHGSEEEGNFFYLKEEDRAFAIAYFYEALAKKHGISYETYRHDLDCFLFYEYCEWVMVGNRYGNKDERFRYYLEKATSFAPSLLG